MTQYPDINTLLAGADPNKLLEVRRSMRSVIGKLVLVLFSAVVIYALNYYFRSAYLRWLALVPALIVVEVVRKYHDDLYILGKDNIKHLSGRLSLRYSIPQVKYVHIRSLSVDQDIWGRIFDFGNVSVQTAAQDKNELLIEGVRDPVGLASLIEELRNLSKKSFEATGVAEPDAGTSALDE